MIYLIWLLGGLLFTSVAIYMLYLFYYQEIYRLEQIAEEYPGYADVRFKLGKIYRERRKYDKAKLYLEEAVKIYPYYLEAYKELYEIFLSLNDRESARNILKRLKQFAESQQDSAMLSFAKNKLAEHENP
ncbi:MAG: tetratricopeptide repeat protein [Candidatus Wallbacteria bacterium]|nr:tetratricopeptide repeat protein [Candidatus Wallbacteria bacterium]